ncbi:MAG: hypothetical protein M3388_11355 [Acidobacteriota bacterium]|nr:hypothetical protein [Acidobacteriota bacterium]
MKTLKQLLFAIAVMICFSMTASAQKEEDKKPPPKKGEPPIIVVEPKDKKPKDEKPKDDKKKPQMFVLYFRQD